jgi:hypothetical protein
VASIAWIRSGLQAAITPRQARTRYRSVVLLGRASAACLALTIPASFAAAARLDPARAGGHLAFARCQDNAWCAANRMHRYLAMVSPAGVEIEGPGPAAAREPWRVRIRLSSFGRAAAVFQVPLGEVHADGDRAEICRAGTGVVEWYVNSAAGIEQGYTIDAPPPGDRREPLELDLEVEGAGWMLAPGSGDQVTFKAHDAAPALEYGHLAVYDRRGRRVPAELAESGGRLQIRVHDRDGEYPLVVDPLLTTPSWTFEGDQAGANLDDGHALVYQGITAPSAPAGFGVEVYVTLTTRPGEISFDAQDNLFVGNYNVPGADSDSVPIWKVSPLDRVPVPFGPPVPDPDVVLVDRDGAVTPPGTILIGSAGAITMESPAGALLGDLATGGCMHNVQGLTLDQSNRLLAIDFPDGDVCLVGGGTSTPLISTGVSNELSQAQVDAAGRLYLSWGNLLKQYNSSGALLNAAFDSGILTQADRPVPAGGAFGGVHFRCGPELRIVEPVTLQETYLLSSPESPVTSMAFNSTGDLFVSEKDNYRILRVYPVCVDQDGDGYGSAGVSVCPGGPGYDCNDADAGAFAVPPEVQGLDFEPDLQTLSWQSVIPWSGAATVHEVARGSLRELPIGGGPSERCLVTGTTSAQWTDPEVPALGQGFWYVVRGRNSCGAWTYGHRSSGQESTTAVCP